MYLFLAPLLFGFALTSASTFTSAFSLWWGERAGRRTCFILRNIVGMPLWAAGFFVAMWAPSTLLFRFTIFTDAAGWLLLAAGVLLILWALSSISLRAVSPSVKDTLVTGGPYGFVRHPLYCGVILEFLGLALINPTLPVVLACSLGILWLVVQAMLEEYDLCQRIPSYREYSQRVPRFVPHFWKNKDNQARL